MAYGLLVYIPVVWYCVWGINFIGTLTSHLCVQHLNRSHTPTHKLNRIPTLPDMALTLELNRILTTPDMARVPLTFQV